MTDILTQKKIAKTKYQNAKRSALKSYDQQKLEIDKKQKALAHHS